MPLAMTSLQLAATGTRGVSRMVSCYYPKNICDGVRVACLLFGSKYVIPLSRPCRSISSTILSISSVEQNRYTMDLIKIRRQRAWKRKRTKPWIGSGKFFADKKRENPPKGVCYVSSLDMYAHGDDWEG